MPTPRRSRSRSAAPSSGRASTPTRSARGKSAAAVALAASVPSQAAAKARTGQQAFGGEAGEINPYELGAAMTGLGMQGTWGCDGASIPGGPACTYLPCPAPTLKTYRRMVDNPTIALALAIAKAPAKSAKWSVVTDKGAPAGAEQLISDYVLPMRPTILRDGLRAVQYGWQPFEIVWDFVNGQLVPWWAKPLLPDYTQIHQDRSGSFDGLTNKGVTLGPLDSFVVTIDGEAGNPYGRSRLESVREKAWWPWEETLARLQQYLMKSGGIIPRITYPTGTSKGPDGRDIPNNLIAQQMLYKLQRGGSILIPMELAAWAEGFLSKGIDPTKIASWQFDFVEAKNLHGDEFAQLLSKFESLQMRGLLVPERAGIEGSTGTKAEADSHGDVAVSVCQDTIDQTVQCLNEGVVDKVLALNYGMGAVGTVRIEAAPLADEQRALVKEITRSVLTAPANLDLVLEMMDFLAGMEQLGLPTRAGAKQPKPGEDDPNAPDAGPDGNTPAGKDANGPGDNQMAVAAAIWRAGKVFPGGA